MPDIQSCDNLFIEIRKRIPITVMFRWAFIKIVIIHHGYTQTEIYREIYGCNQ